MAKISRDSNIIELDGPPKYNYGDKVKSRLNIRNDGTFRGKEVNELLVSKGDYGYVTSIGTFLQQFYIYGIDFPEHGYKVGMRAKELVPFEEIAEQKIPESEGENA